VTDEWIGAADRSSRLVLRVSPDAWLDEPAGPPVLRGLAANPAAPAEILLRLLGAHPDAVPTALRRRADLSAPVLEAMLRHSSDRIRGALAANRFTDPGIRTRLAGDPGPEVIARLRADRELALPDEVFRPDLDRLDRQFVHGLLNAEELAGEVQNLIAADRRAFAAATRHPSWEIRLGALSPAPSEADAAERLLQDTSPAVRAAAADRLASRDRPMTLDDLRHNGYEVRWLLRTRRLPRAVVDHVLANGYDPDPLAANPHTPSDVVTALFAHPAPQVRRALAGRPDLTPAQLTALATDPDVSVRTAVSVHPALSEEQRSAITIDVTTAAEDLSEDPARSPFWARSVNPLLRRRAARDPRLPADLVPALAEDPDPEVRTLLAHHHPQAPPPLLLRVYRDGTPRRNRLPWLPNFPLTGLAALAADPDPAVRRLAALDPTAPPAVVNRLTRDEDPGVRQAMAGSPRLPVDRILALLTEPDVAGAAAANPALPLEAMRSLL
jgi:hypothetical protein